MRPGRVVTGVLGRPWAIIGCAGVLAFAVWAWGTRSEPHRVRVAFDAAMSLTPGLDVQIDGVDAGKIAKVDLRDGRAVVELGIADAFWPLHRGATATIRYGTTIGNGTRRVDVDPGDPRQPAIPEHGIISSANATSPVELDEVLNTLDGPSRTALRGSSAAFGTALDGRGRPIASALRRAPGGLRATTDVVGDLVADTAALQGLVRDGATAAGALAQQDDAISELVRVGAATFDAFARRTGAVTATLDALPGALAETRTTLARADRSVGGLDALVADLRPGAATLRPLARDLRRGLVRLRRVAPDATATLRTVRTRGGEVAALLREARPFVAQAGTTLRTAAPSLGCVRPYAPEIAGTFANWAGFTKNHDATAHYGRVAATFSAMDPLIPPVRTADFLALIPGITYAFPRPPGYNSGQSWLLPQCGVGPEALDPAKDPEDDRPSGVDQQEDTLPGGAR